MLEYINAEIAELTPASVVLDCNGLGYLINISLNTYSQLQGQKKAKLYIYEAIREDAHLLFGFHDKSERECFLLLISVSGVGANTARMILSSLSVHELEQAIATGSVNALKSVKGIGLKTAQRIIVDLKDKIKLSSSNILDDSSFTLSNTAREEALGALVTLGFPQPASLKVVEKVLKENPSMTVEQIIKTALRML